MVFIIKNLFCLIFLHSILGSPHVNLDLTDWINKTETYVELQHTCLHVLSVTEKELNLRQIISYSLTEWPLEWNVTENNFDPKLTFADLYNQHVTSEQLYQWSASIDLIELYQFYVDQRSISNEFQSNDMDLFYNYFYDPQSVSLTKNVHQFYEQYYKPTSFASLCLDWTDVCDGYVDCINNQIDEEYCWQLKISECNENEYRCDNGQCISKEFNGDQRYTFDCLDRSDPFLYRDYLYFSTSTIEPSIHEEDIQCLRSFSHSTIQFTSSCFDEQTPSLMSDDCWSIFRPHYICYNDRFCNGFSSNKTILKFNDTTYRRPEDFQIIIDEFNSDYAYVLNVYKQLYHCNPMIAFSESTICNKSIMYQCLNSSKYDEQCPLINGTCAILDSDILFKCKSTNQCISRKLLDNGAFVIVYLHMMMRHVKMKTNMDNLQKELSFPKICNGIIDMNNILIDNQNETDETELNDGQIDCLGATDEPKLCQQDNEPLTTEYFYCKNDSNRNCLLYEWCSEDYQCLHRDEEPLLLMSFFCKRFHYFGGTREFFYLPDEMKFPQENNRIIKQETKMVDNEMKYDQQRCHRGLPLRVCYYGNECQYQNQRIRLTVQFRTYSNSRRSFLKSIDFPFLPVNRIAILLNIPSKTQLFDSCTIESCQNGRCMKYIDDPFDRTFCQCYSGQCIPDDQQLIRSEKFLFVFVHGIRCENIMKNIILPQSMIVHFIYISSKNEDFITNGSIVETISIHKKTMIIYWSYEFHIAFVQLYNNYYLILVDSKYNKSTTISRTIHSSDRCKHLNELLDMNIVNLHLLRRIKYYQKPCQDYAPELKCFYDQDYFCLCYNFTYQRRLANCFQFNSSLQHNCYGLSVCENDAQCIQDTSKCPKVSIDH
ncbi:hypothetical protein I4U23_022476 [Adineta vaga]|nr:hypothetical protein I4U23_022476 [Adineta vaga]